MKGVLYVLKGVKSPSDEMNVRRYFRMYARVSDSEPSREHFTFPSPVEVEVRSMGNETHMAVLYKKISSFFWKPEFINFTLERYTGKTLSVRNNVSSIDELFNQSQTLKTPSQ